MRLSSPPILRLFRPRAPAFTLVEVLVSVAIMAMLLAIMLSISTYISTSTTHASSYAEAGESAYTAFLVLRERISRATLNERLEYLDGGGNVRTASNVDAFVPDRIAWFSDLRFIIRTNRQAAGYGQEIFFMSGESMSARPEHGSLGGLLNACGFLVRYGPDDCRPDINGLKPRYGYRLMETMLSTEDFMPSSDIPKQLVDDQVKEPAGTSLRPLCDDVIAFVVLPRLPAVHDFLNTSLPASYTYDSADPPSGASWLAHRLPPLVQITMIVVEKPSMARFETGTAEPPSEIQDALEGKFANPGQYDSDLDQVKTALDRHSIRYKIFSAVVSLKEAHAIKEEL